MVRGALERFASARHEDRQLYRDFFEAAATLVETDRAVRPRCAA
jgi:hypothetical protein